MNQQPLERIDLHMIPAIHLLDHIDSFLYREHRLLLDIHQQRDYHFVE
jgi:hypothetical protein